jgi:hypothetical protein
MTQLTNNSCQISDESTSMDSNEDKYVDVKEMQFTGKEKYYFNSADRYYKRASIDQSKKMKNIINGDSKMSLRLFDWFATKYTDRNTIKIKQSRDEHDRIDVHISYKAQLKTFKKRYFDPFKRYKKFYYVIKIGQDKYRFLTTIGQLNFFQWAFTSEILKYVENNFDSLSAEMFVSNKKDRESSQQRKKTKELKSQSSKDNVTIKKGKCKITAKKVRSLLNNEQKIVISFD